MRIAIVAGEASGDLLGAGLVKALKTLYPHCSFEGIGGEKMIEAGVKSFFPLERLAVMGLIEPLKRLRELLGIRRFLREHFIQNPPDVFIGIDAPDFNLNLELALRNNGIKTVHYVSPSVWAWRQGRVKKIKRAVDLMLTLFPHEEHFYQTHNVNVACVGHTLADQIPLVSNTQNAREQLGLDSNATAIALLPGSRGAEIKYLWPEFIRAAKLLLKSKPEAVFLVPAANSARKLEIVEALRHCPDLPITVFDGESHSVMLAADVVVMASGTTTLEAMLLKKPMVITYKMAWLSFAILSRLVKISHIGLPNILANKALVPELIQSAVTAENIVREVNLYFEDPVRGQLLVDEFSDIHRQLKRNANIAAATNIAQLIEINNDKE